MTKLLIWLLGPPVLTLVCWMGSWLLPRLAHEKLKPLTWSQVWLLLISAYVMFAVGLWGAEWSARHERADPTDQMVQ